MSGTARDFGNMLNQTPLKKPTKKPRKSAWLSMKKLGGKGY